MLLTYVQLEVFISGKMHFTKIGDASTYNAIPTNAVHQCICMCLNGLHFELWMYSYIIIFLLFSGVWLVD